MQKLIHLETIYESDEIALKTDIPTLTSELTNDSNFVIDANYVHTDNNFSDTEKSKVDSALQTLPNGTVIDTNYVHTDNNLTDGLVGLIQGADQVESYPTLQTALIGINNFDSGQFNIGQSILIVQIDVPDLWLSNTFNVSVPYTYVSDAQFIADVVAGGGSLQVGYYNVSFLETSKIDLDNYLQISNNLSDVNDQQTALNNITNHNGGNIGDVLAIGVDKDVYFKTLSKSDVGLGNVDNTSDANKPVSTAQATAIGLKQDALGFTPENVANKKTSLAENSDTYYPTQKAVKTAVDAKQDTITPTVDTTPVDTDYIITQRSGGWLKTLVSDWKNYFQTKLTFSTDIEADKLSTTKVSTIKPMVDWVNLKIGDIETLLSAL